MDVFAHVCGPKADTSSNYYDISHMTRDVSVFVKCDTIFRFFFENYHNFILLTFAR